MRATRLLAACLLAATAAAAPPDDDPLADEIARWVAAGEVAVAPAAAALRDGRRLLALRRLAGVRADLAAAAYVRKLGGEKAEAALLETEWRRLGPELRAVESLGGVRPAAVRAVGEAALAPVRVLYEASRDYGRCTSPADGLAYLGAALGQKGTVALARSLASGTTLAEPPLRSLAPDLDAFEAELFAAYRPPLSIDRHRDFIAVSATLKEARELDEAGLRHGALLRYLEAAQRFAALRTPPPLDAARLGEMEAALSESGVDHGIGALFLEEARTDAAAAPAIASDVLPRYLAALAPAPAAARMPAPRVTVTLVRWPYT